MIVVAHGGKLGTGFAVYLARGIISGSLHRRFLLVGFVQVTC